MTYHYASRTGTSIPQSFADIEQRNPTFIYASYKPNAKETPQQALEHIAQLHKHWLNCFVDDQFIKIAVDDLLAIDPVFDGAYFYIPLCGIVKTPIDFNRFQHLTLKAHLLYADQTPTETMQNHGYLAINSQDNIWSNRNNIPDNWKNFIPKDHIKMLADMEHERTKLYQTLKPDQLAWITKPIY